MNSPPTTVFHHLQSLLTKFNTLPPTYNNGLANHLPMALHSLQALGADSSRMDAFASFYVAAHYADAEPRDTSAEAPLEWLSLRGKDTAFPQLSAWFERAISERGSAAVLRETLPSLITDVSAAAFHGVIRTAHAVQAQHEAEIAQGLAYWAMSWKPLRPPTTAPPASELLSLAEWSSRLCGAAKQWTSGRAGLITDRMNVANDSDVYNQLAAALVPAPTERLRIEEFARFALESYITSRNFVVLHMVTGMRALRVLLPWIDNATLATLQPLLAQTICAAYLAAEARPFHSRLATPPHTWEAVVRVALDSKDEHVVKLIHACREESSVYGNEDRYLDAAALIAAGPAIMRL